MYHHVLGNLLLQLLLSWTTGSNVQKLCDDITGRCVSICSDQQMDLVCDYHEIPLSVKLNQSFKQSITSDQQPAKYAVDRDFKTCSGVSRKDPARRKRMRKPLWWKAWLPNIYTFGGMVLTTRSSELRFFKNLTIYVEKSDRRPNRADKYQSRGICYQNDGRSLAHNSISLLCEKQVAGNQVRIQLNRNSFKLKLCDIKLYGVREGKITSTLNPFIGSAGIVTQTDKQLLSSNVKLNPTVIIPTTHIRRKHTTAGLVTKYKIPTTHESRRPSTVSLIQTVKIPTIHIQRKHSTVGLGPTVKIPTTHIKPKHSTVGLGPKVTIPTTHIKRKHSTVGLGPTVKIPSAHITLTSVTGRLTSTAGIPLTYIPEKGVDTVLNTTVETNTTLKQPEGIFVSWVQLAVGAGATCCVMWVLVVGLIFYCRKQKRHNREEHSLTAVVYQVRPENACVRESNMYEDLEELNIYQNCADSVCVSQSQSHMDLEESDIYQNCAELTWH